MEIIKLLILFIFILIVNKCLIRLDYNKIFKKNSDKEIFIINMALSIVIGYLIYKAILEIYYLSTNIL
ncbi:DUF1146 family protein [Gemelliphila palaticanis]|uniref:DUF1146 domain-containing protein n=1 Tax=Gemelliphila palaticanis TaxID=81950 RepID=A0ABX2SZL9_9BACL|nr:DUF1146 family protein [Gemella palaticanis]MBF0715819.1 DUF1146 domain-containing protein [Gemella palaticanis]NYS47749.1 DUF1146 domain-containing protein [Gemella palaticanis]